MIFEVSLLSVTLLSLVQPVQAQTLQDGNLCKIVTWLYRLVRSFRRVVMLLIWCPINSIQQRWHKTMALASYL
jgi:hypothetical protein